jgi:hypothetical protein
MLFQKRFMQKLDIYISITITVLITLFVDY